MNCWLPKKADDGRVTMLFNDFVIKYDVCNFSCDYCLNKMKPYESKIWKGTEKDNIENCCQKDEDYSNDESEGMEPMVYSDTSSLGKRMDSLVENFDKAIDAVILRLSGGEVLQIKGIEDFISKQSPKYEVVQVVTNGFFLSKDTIQRLKNVGNCHLHYSLDGHTLELNGNRVKIEAVQKRLMDNLQNAVQIGLPVEINSVMTSANTKNYVDFLEYLLRYEGKVIAHPSPVRGEPLRSFYPDRDSIESFTKILDNYDRYENILPPKAYMEGLVKFMNDDKRTLRCHLAKAAIQSIDDGILTPCPNGWTIQLGNVLTEDPHNVASRIGHDKVYNLLLHERPRLDYCKICYTAYDVLNLYINGKISDKELERLPLYSGPKVKSRMKLLRDQ